MFKKIIYAVMYLFMIENIYAKTLIKTINISINIDIDLSDVNKYVENKLDKFILDYESYRTCEIICDSGGICYLNNNTDI